MLGVLDIGINPGLKLPAEKPIYPWSLAGMVTISVGNNTWAGGDNAVSFGLAPVPNATATVDGKVLVRDGEPSQWESESRHSSRRDRHRGRAGDPGAIAEPVACRARVPLAILCPP